MTSKVVGGIALYLFRVMLFLAVCGCTALLLHLLFRWELWDAWVAVVLVDYAMDRTHRYGHKRDQDAAISSYVDRQIRVSR